MKRKGHKNARAAVTAVASGKKMSVKKHGSGFAGGKRSLGI
jgi:hypothetical protein